MTRSTERPRIINQHGTYWLIPDGKVAELSFKTVDDARAFTAAYTSATTDQERHAAIDAIIVRVAETR